MLACSCKGRRFQNYCINCGTKCFPVFTVELILIFFVQTTLFLLAFKKFVRLLCKKVFLVCKPFPFFVFPNGLLPVSDNHGRNLLFSSHNTVCKIVKMA